MKKIIEVVFDRLGFILTLILLVASLAGYIKWSWWFLLLLLI